LAVTVAQRSIPELQALARQIRLDSLEATVRAGKGHLGGTYSCTDMLVALYYGGVLRFDAGNPRDPQRDRFLIGKGHACLALYAIFRDLGMISRETFERFGENGGPLGGQLDVSTPGVEYNTGSLGHVLGIGAGIALAAKMDDADYRAFVMLGDAECYEGSIWEAIIFAGDNRLSNLVGIIDRNRLSVTDVLDDDGFFNEFQVKLHNFGWNPIVIDGHDFSEIIYAFENAMNSDLPSMIIANTIKGKGVSFMEGGVKWHHSVPSGAELEIARAELSADPAEAIR
jgi:transketolase